MKALARGRYWSLGIYCTATYTVAVIIPNRTFLVRVRDISGEFGWARVRILATHSQATIPMVRPKKPDMLLKHTKKGTIRYLPCPSSQSYNIKSLTWYGYDTHLDSRHGFLLANYEFGYGNKASYSGIQPNMVTFVQCMLQPRESHYWKFPFLSFI